MDFKATSTERRAGRRQAGATIAEFVVAAGIGSVLLAVFVSFAIYQGRSFTVLFNMADIDQQNRQALDWMTREIRQVNKVTTYSTNAVEFQDHDNATLTYTYSPGARTLTRTKNGVSTVLLREIEVLEFRLMQRNIVEGSYAYYPAETIAEAKVIGITWETSRAIMGTKTGMSGTQTARIVIRKA